MIENFAKFFYLDHWDWFALTIAIFSLCVAYLSFRIASRTLESQRKTERNTSPLFTKENQLETLEYIAKSIVSSYILAKALSLSLKQIKDNTLVSELLIPDLKIQSEEIHLELFYGCDVKSHISNASIYSVLSNLKDTIKLFNEKCDIIGKHLASQDIKISTKIKEFDVIVNNIKSIIVDFRGAMMLMDDFYPSMQQYYVSMKIEKGFLSAAYEKGYDRKKYDYFVNIETIEKESSILSEDIKMWEHVIYLYFDDAGEGIDFNFFSLCLYYAIKQSQRKIENIILL